MLKLFIMTFIIILFYSLALSIKIIAGTFKNKKTAPVICSSCELNGSCKEEDRSRHI